MEHPFLMFLDHTQRRTTVGRTSDQLVAETRSWVLNPTGGTDICLLWVSCVVRKRSPRRADHSSRGVLPTVVHRCVWSRNIKNGCSIYIYI